MILLIIAMRPALPLMNFVVNYDYIAQNLCENRDRPELSCHGKCYLAKEIAKTEKQQSTDNSVKISSLDIFIVKDIMDATMILLPENPDQVRFSSYRNDYHSDFNADIFHPPLV